MLDEGVVQAELARYRPEVLPKETKAPVRQAVVQQDDALRRAGRIVIRMAWQDPAVLAHVETILTLEKLADPVQREILLLLSRAFQRAVPWMRP